MKKFAFLFAVALGLLVGCTEEPKKVDKKV